MVLAKTQAVFDQVMAKTLAIFDQGLVRTLVIFDQKYFVEVGITIAAC
jgi:hypothetical protein